MSRRPLPTETKRSRGETRPSRTNAKEPKLAVGEPAPPAHLDGEALREWKRIVPKLIGAKVLTEVDGQALGAYCELYADCVWLGSEMKKATGTDREKLMMRRHKALHSLRLFLIEFGMTPAARSKVRSVDAGTEDPLAEWEKLKKAHTVAGGKKD